MKQYIVGTKQVFGGHSELEYKSEATSMLIIVINVSGSQWRRHRTVQGKRKRLIHTMATFR